MRQSGGGWDPQDHIHSCQPPVGARPCGTHGTCWCSPTRSNTLSAGVSCRKRAFLPFLKSSTK